MWRYSPFRGATFTVQYALADVVNDLHGNEFWAAISSLAIKARVNRRTAGLAVAELVAGGWLEVLEDHRYDKAGRPSRYRFLCPEELPLVFESRPKGGAVSDRTPAAGGAVSDRTQVRCQTAGGAVPHRTKQKEPNYKQKLLLPDDFALTEAMRQWAAVKGYATLDLEAETDQFRDHWTSKGERRVDWVATWYTWIRNAAKWQAERERRRRPPSPAGGATVTDLNNQERWRRQREQG